MTLDRWRVDIEAAVRRLDRVAHKTPLVRSRLLDERAGSRIWLKCENLQRGGAFKFRGAWNAVSSLPEADAGRGVVTHSSGNHAQALALAARLRGIPAHIVMPENALGAKIAAVRDYGGRIRFCAPTQEARETTAREVLEETGGVFISPFDDALIVAGQATAARELLLEVPDLEMIVAPIGGGGLLAGSTLSAALHDPSIRVVGAEPAEADDAHRSLLAGRRLPVENPWTIADGLRVSVGEIPFSILHVGVDSIVTVSEVEIVEAMRWTWERTKLLIEPSSAVPLAALFASGRIDDLPERIGVIVSGGNVDLDHLPWLESLDGTHRDDDTPKR